MACLRTSDFSVELSAFCDDQAYSKAFSVLARHTPRTLLFPPSAADTVLAPPDLPIDGSARARAPSCACSSPARLCVGLRCLRRSQRPSSRPRASSTSSVSRHATPTSEQAASTPNHAARERPLHARETPTYIPRCSTRAPAHCPAQAATGTRSKVRAERASPAQPARHRYCIGGLHTWPESLAPRASPARVHHLGVLIA
jgi:hypothetical protein